MSIAMTQNPSNTTFRFKNGYKMSVVIGPGSYSSEHMISEDIVDGNMTRGVDSSNAEIAIIRPNGEFHRIEGQDDDVIGWVPAEKIIEVAYWVARGDMAAVADIFQINWTFPHVSVKEG
jgi:hypothetical protein